MQLMAINVSHATDLNLRTARRRRERQRKKNERASRFLYQSCLGGLSLWEQIRVCASFFLSGGATKKPITSVSIAPVNAARPLWLRFMELLQRTKSYTITRRKGTAPQRGEKTPHTFSIVVTAFLGVLREMLVVFSTIHENNQYPAAGAISK